MRAMRPTRALAAFAVFLLAVLAVSATAAPASADATDRWQRCRAAEPDVSITACSEIIARGKREKKSRRIEAYINRGSAYRLKGKLDLALADLDKGLRLNPMLPRALIARAAIHAAKGNLDQAIAGYTKAIAAQPKSVEAYHGRAITYRSKGQLGQALADLGEAIRRDPESSSLRLERAAEFEAKGDLDAAIADYDEAIKHDQTLAEAYNRRGLAFSAKGEFGRAVADYSRVLTLDPAFANAFVNRAKAYLEQQDLELAREDLEAALNLNPELASAKSALDEVNKLLAGRAAEKTQAADHGNLPWPLALPFAGMLLSIALGPVVVREWWHIHYEKAAAFWAGLTLAGLSAAAGPSAAAAEFVHAMALEYLPFILMLFALYTAAGGIRIEGKLKGTPLGNLSLLASGTLIASIIGTTGASMILIRPLLGANAARKHNAHVVVVFIFLVSHIGGVLTPLGDPPLFLGYLNGIDFFWPARNLWPQALFTAGILLAIFFVLDSLFYRRDESNPPYEAAATSLRISGLANVALIGGAIFAIVASGFWRPGIGLDILGTRIELQNLVANWL
jgi:tetratricopeptide (TPR) repeat protein